MWYSVEFLVGLPESTPESTHALDAFWLLVPITGNEFSWNSAEKKTDYLTETKGTLFNDKYADRENSDDVLFWEVSIVTKQKFLFPGRLT